MTQDDSTSRKATFQDDAVSRRAIRVDDVDGHAVAKATEDVEANEDVSGHRGPYAMVVPPTAPKANALRVDDEDDVQGHGRVNIALTGELDAERHIARRP